MPILLYSGVLHAITLPIIRSFLNGTGKLCLSFLMALFFPIAELSGQDQDKQQAAELVEMGREMRKAALALDDIREIMVQAANLDTANLDANLEAGILHLNTVHKDQALKYFLRIHRVNPGYRTDLEFWIGMSYQYGLKFNEAIGFYERFRKKVTSGQATRSRIAVYTIDRKIEECRTGIDLVTHPKAYRIENMGPGVNSEADDYSPSMDIDEDVLVFTSRRRDGNINENVSLVDNKPFEDIFISKKTADNWTPAANIGPPVNTMGNDSGLGFSPDGNILYTYAKGDIYSTQFKSDGNWSTPSPLPYPINTDSTEKGFTITGDGALAVFASRRAGGIGGLDLYMVRRNADGSWGEAHNLGPAINTEHNEESPYIDPTGKVLFFSSNGKKCMGGYDVFRSKLIEAKAGTWSEPENLGYPINTPDDDLFFIGSKDDKRGYFASVREGGFGYMDIYRVFMPEFKPEKAAILPIKLTIQLKDGQTGEILAPNLTLVYANTMKTAAVPLRIGNTTVFYLRSTEAQDYMLNATAEGYEAATFRLPMPGTTTVVQLISRDLVLSKSAPGKSPGPEKKIETPVQVLKPEKPTEAGLADSPLKPVPIGSDINRVFFDFGSAAISPAAQEALVSVVDELKRSSGRRVELLGHADASGSTVFNESLAKARAEAVKRHLVASGIDAGRISVKAYGERRPLVSNDDESEGREINRRVEIRYQD